VGRGEAHDRERDSEMREHTELKRRPRKGRTKRSLSKPDREAGEGSELPARKELSAKKNHTKELIGRSALKDALRRRSKKEPLAAKVSDLGGRRRRLILRVGIAYRRKGLKGTSL